MSFVRANGVVHHYRHVPARSASLPALVCVHSLGTDERIWDGMLDALDWPGAVLRYDLRGHGLTEIGEVPYGIRGLAADASALLSALGIEAAFACGLSIGALIAAELAASDARVRGLALCGAAARMGTPDGWQARIEQVRARGIAGVADVVVGRWFSAAYRERAAADVRGHRCMLERTPQAGYLASLSALAVADLRPCLPTLRVPVLVVSGSRDEVAPPGAGRELAALVPGGARFELLEGARHLLAVEKPRELARAIAQFAEGLQRV